MGSACSVLRYSVPLPSRSSRRRQCILRSCEPLVHATHSHHTSFSLTARGDSLYRFQNFCVCFKLFMIQDVTVAPDLQTHFVILHSAAVSSKEKLLLRTVVLTFRYKVIALHSILSTQDQAAAFTLPPPGVRKVRLSPAQVCGSRWRRLRGGAGTGPRRRLPVEGPQWRQRHAQRWVRVFRQWRATKGMGFRRSAS